jgi:hypothetical protein
MQSSPTMSQKLTAEAIGTAILVFIGAGSVPLTVFLTGKNPFGSAELSTISFCFAFAIFAAVYSVGHISGCHINPAVTVALWATRKVDSQTALGYIGAQIVGAFIGAALTLIVLSGNDPQTLGLGAVSVNANSGNIVGLLAEVIGTGILVFTVFGAAVDRPGRGFHLVGHRRGEDVPGSGRVEHPEPDEPPVEWLVSGSAAGDQPDLAGPRPAGAENDVVGGVDLDDVGVGCGKAREGLGNDVLDLVEELLDAGGRVRCHLGAPS